MVVAHRVGGTDRVGSRDHQRDLRRQEVQRRGVLPLHGYLGTRRDAKAAGCRLLHPCCGRIGGCGRCDRIGVVHAPIGVECGHRMAGAIHPPVGAQENAVVQAVAGRRGTWRINLPGVVEATHLDLGGVLDIKVQAIGGRGATGGVELNRHGLRQRTEPKHHGQHQLNHLTRCRAATPTVHDKASILGARVGSGQCWSISAPCWQTHCVPHTKSYPKFLWTQPTATGKGPRCVWLRYSLPRNKSP